MEATTVEPIRVLIVDSNPQVGRALVRLLQPADDIEVVATAADENAVLELALRLRPAVALVDVGDGRMDGIEITQALSKQSPTRVVVLSVYATFSERALAAGACWFLLKDCRREELVVAIRLAAHGQCQSNGEQHFDQVGLHAEQPRDSVTSTSLPAPRLYFLTAKEAPIVVVLRRAPSKRYHIIKINTQSAAMEQGSWFIGSLYGDACDLSFDGEWLVYKALGAGGAVWTGICRPPWLKTYREWENLGTWNGGGCFASRKLLQINAWSPMKVTQAAPLPFVCRQDSTEHNAEGKIVLPDYLVARLIREGWRRRVTGEESAMDTSQANPRLAEQYEWLCQPSKDHPTLRMDRRPLREGKRVRFALDHPADLIDADVEWANWDALGNLIVARQGMLQKYTLADLASGQPSLSWDLRKMTPKEGSAENRQQKA